jgi:predicted nucleic acid-binding protein
MRIDRVVINASPLITLFRSQQAELLPDLFLDIVVPEAVWIEVQAGVQDEPTDTAARELPRSSWVTRSTVDISPRIVAWNLGAGESAVLSFALDHPGYRAVIDDRAARRCARTLGIRHLGTGGMLVLAKRRGLINSVGERLRRLKEAGLWLSDDLIALLLREAGE